MKLKCTKLLLMVVCAIGITSCDPDDKVTEVNIVNYAGDFAVVNQNTNEMIIINGTTGSVDMTVNIKPNDANIKVVSDHLLAHNGDTLKIKFYPKEEYKSYSYNTKYILPNGIEGIGDKSYEYEYIVQDVQVGEYSLTLNASYNKDGNNLTAEGKFTLEIPNHTDVEYTLVCSNDLWKYGTPIISYIDNDRTSITFPIPETGWTEVGDDKIQWTYNETHYDNFSFIDADMTITYEPKENIPDTIYVASLKSTLEALVKVQFSNGRTKTERYSNSKNSIHVSVGSTLSLSDIFSDYKNYLGILIDDNDATCSQKNK